MDRRTLTVLVASLVALVALVGLCGQMAGGIPASTRRMLEQARSEVPKKAEQVEQSAAAAEAILKEHAALQPLAQDEGWAQKLAASRDEVKRASENLKAAAAVVERDDRKERTEAENLIFRANDAAAHALATTAAIEKRAREALRYLKEGPALADKAKAEAERYLESPIPAELERKAQAVATDWPDKSREVQQQLESLQRGAEQVRQTVPRLEAPSPLQQGLAAEAVLSTVETQRKAAQNLSERIDQLYYSYDKILADLDDSAAKPRAKYQVIRIDKDNQKSESTAWEDITAAELRQLTPNLGMTVVSKPKGVFEDEAVRTPSPPGYNYVGNPHYGQWRYDSSGNRFWEWYGKYAFFSTLFFGPSWGRPIYYGDYSSYRDNLRQGRPWYGRSATGGDVWGTRGAQTQERYSDSRFGKKAFGSGSSSANRGVSRTPYGGGSSSRSTGWSSGRSSSRGFGGSRFGGK